MNRDEILEVLRRFKESNGDKYKIDSLGIFGSAARQSRNKKSDIDVVVVLMKVDAFNLIGIKQELEEQFRCHVDVVRYRAKGGSNLSGLLMILPIQRVASRSLTQFACN